MVTHLGSGHEEGTGFKPSEGPRSKAGKALILHINQYNAKGFHIRTVTSDGEGAVKSARTSVEELGAQLNILGHGSHTPHAEAAIRHVKNTARDTLFSLPFPLPLRLAPALCGRTGYTGPTGRTGPCPAYCTLTSLSNLVHPILPPTVRLHPCILLASSSLLVEVYSSF